MVSGCFFVSFVAKPRISYQDRFTTQIDMKKNQYMLATAILAGGLIFALTGQAQQQPGKGKTRPGQGKAGPGQGQRPGQGQARPGQGERPQRPGGGFSRRNPYEGVGLSEAQQAKITAIQQAQSAEIRELFQELRDGGGDRQALGAKMTALREKYQKQTDAILTDDQKKKMAEARAQRGQGGRGQGQPRPGGFGRRNPYEGIGLNEEQQKKITAIQQEQSAEMRELFQELRDGGGDRQALGAKMAELREKYQKKTDAVLTDDQKKKMAEARAQRDQGRQPGGQGRRPGGQGGRGGSLASLNLTEEQQKKVTALQAANRTAMQELFRSGDRETMREKMTELRAKYDKQVEALLTDEQKKKYKEMQAQRGQRGPGGGRPRPDGKSKERPKRSDA